MPLIRYGKVYSSFPDLISTRPISAISNLIPKKNISFIHHTEGKEKFNKSNVNLSAVLFEKARRSKVPFRKESLLLNVLKLKEKLQNSKLEELENGKISECLQKKVPLDSDKSAESDKSANKRMANLNSWKWLTDISPGFSMNGSQMQIIHDPRVFYTTVLEKSLNAKTRVSFASLYIGNGNLEKELVTALKNNMESNEKLNVKVLLDYSRGSRGMENSRSILSPLLQNDQFQLFLYHTPTLRGFVKRWLPQRWNEIIGLQHMKIYIFDNTLIITGANLSNDYFSNRQDRYFLIEDCKELADFYDGLIDQVGDFSFNVDKNNKEHLHPNWDIHPSQGDQLEFVKVAKERVTSYYDAWQKGNEERIIQFYKASENEDKKSSGDGKCKEQDTWVFPLIQMGCIDIGLDNFATSKIFEEASADSNIKLATGYFNLTSDYIQKIIEDSAANYDILMAHPKANGFLGAKGFAGGIPAAYTLLAKKFLDRVKISKQESRIGMWEYIRPSWTFHSKGLWFFPPGKTLPLVTLIGSPNFGHRSVYRDLETQLYVISTNLELQTQMNEEQKALFRECKHFGEETLVQRDRIVPLWVKMVIMFFRNFF